MEFAFPIMGNGYPTARISISLSRDYLVPNCKDCGQKMNEIYLLDGCEYQKDDIHIHFSHRHYESNREYRTHYCYPSKRFYESR